MTERRDRNAVLRYTPSPSPRSLGAAASAALLLLAQVVAIFHGALVGHAISPETGRIVHPGDEHAKGGSSDDDGDPHRGHSGGGDEDCQILAVMHQAASTCASPSPSIASAPFISSLPPIAVSAPSPNRWALYLLAPSHSPPSA